MQEMFLHRQLELKTPEEIAVREEVETVWWNQLGIQVLPTLVPFIKWKEQYPRFVKLGW